MHALQLIYITHIYTAKTQLSFCTHTHLCDAINQSVSIFWLIYMRCNHIHCKDTTQSLLIYTEWQQRLCTCIAIHIHHTYIYCEDMIQLLHIYTSVQHSKLIDFNYLIDLHASQSYILQRHDTIFAHIYRMTVLWACIERIIWVYSN